MNKEIQDSMQEESGIAEVYFLQSFLEDQRDFDLSYLGLQVPLEAPIGNFLDELPYFVHLASVDALIYQGHLAHWFGEATQEFDPESFDILPFEETATADPLASELHPEAEALYNQANELYLKDPDKKYPYIQINSGVRSTQRQAELYIGFIHSRYGGPAVPRANKPGTSNHEYGLAIDVLRKLDEARLRKALMEAKWTNNIADEGWHFDAEGIASWATLQQKIQGIRKNLSDPFGEEVASQFEFEKLIKENYPKSENERNRLQTEQQRLIKVQDGLKKEQTQLVQEQIHINDEINSIRREIDSLKRLQTRIKSFRYTYCPNRNVFNNCNHVAEKRRYVNERNGLVNTYNQRARVLEQRNDTLNRRIKRFESDWQSFDTAVKRFESEANQFQIDLDAFNKLVVRINKWFDRRQKILDDRPAKISAIAIAVDQVRVG